jgi:callose synthase
MAFELYGMLAGNVSPLTGEPVKPAYGGENEAFLMKVIKPIYDTIHKVCFYFIYELKNCVSFLSTFCFLCVLLISFFVLQESLRSKGGKAKHSHWRNYDDLNEFFWYYASFCSS